MVKWWMLPCCFLAVHVCLQTYCLILSCVWHLFGLWAGASMHTCAVSIVKKNWPINFAVTPQRWDAAINQDRTDCKPTANLFVQSWRCISKISSSFAQSTWILSENRTYRREIKHGWEILKLHGPGKSGFSHLCGRAEIQHAAQSDDAVHFHARQNGVDARWVAAWSVESRWLGEPIRRHQWIGNHLTKRGFGRFRTFELRVEIQNTNLDLVQFRTIGTERASHLEPRFSNLKSPGLQN